MKSLVDLRKEIEILKREIIHKGMRKLTSSNIQKQNKLIKLIKECNE